MPKDRPERLHRIRGVFLRFGDVCQVQRADAGAELTYRLEVARRGLRTLGRAAGGEADRITDNVRNPGLADEPPQAFSLIDHRSLIPAVIDGGKVRAK